MTGRSTPIASEPAAASSSSESIDLSSVVELALERRHIRRLQNLSQLKSLRRASFADNQISHIEGLEGCALLEELSLEDNRLSSIEGLNGLTRCQSVCVDDLCLEVQRDTLG